MPREWRLKFQESLDVSLETGHFLLQFFVAMAMEVWTALAVVTVTAALFRVFLTIVWEPLRLRRIMAKQGVNGPRFHLLMGNLPEIAAFQRSQPEIHLPPDYMDHSTASPHSALYVSKYGKRFVYCRGSATRLVVREPEFVKEVLSSQSEFFTRPLVEIDITSQVVGRGVFVHEGQKWAIERHTLNPFFHQAALKGMAQAMVKGAASEIQKWEQMVGQAGGKLELDVVPDIHTISGKIITYTAFATAEFEKGKQIFELQTQIAKYTVEAIYSLTYWIPGFSLLPTQKNRLLAECKSKVDTLLHEIIRDRRKAVEQGRTDSYGNDLLGRMIAAASDGTDPNTCEFNLASVFNNTKNIYFAGQDTVANVTSFTMLMLARHQEWQDRARKEVLEVVVDEEELDPSLLSHLKVVTMILNEVMRIFTPTPSLSRVATKDLQIGDLFIPKGLEIELVIGDMHTDPEYWGKDAGEFNPGRFANGVANACTHPQAFTPFGIGPKHCIGSNFGLMELKIVVSMVLRRFHLSISPNYKHHPINELLQRPKHGIPLILNTL